ncbi:hypothetical protein B0H13DRAFT_2359746 [Mycena leptocephala]|nr:hypothetical protein B0H13DRAFT_2359746 [Mycena leptocephala]
MPQNIGVASCAARKMKIRAIHLVRLPPPALTDSHPPIHLLIFLSTRRGCAGSVPSTFYNPRASACPAWRPYFRVSSEGNYGGARSRNDAHALGKTYYARLRDAHLHPHLGVYPSALSPLPLMTPHLHLCKVHSSIRVLASLGTPPSALPLITGCSARTASLMPIRTKSHAISLVLPSPLCVSAGRAPYGGSGPLSARLLAWRGVLSRALVMIFFGPSRCDSRGCNPGPT